MFINTYLLQNIPCWLVDALQHQIEEFLAPASHKTGVTCEHTHYQARAKVTA